MEEGSRDTEMGTAPASDTGTWNADKLHCEMHALKFHGLSVLVIEASLFSGNLKMETMVLLL